MRLSGTKATAIHQYRGLGNQLWDLAGNRPSLDLRFADSKSLVDATTGTNLIDFTRASSGTYVGSDGLIKTATTNLLLRSEEFDNASWGKTSTTVTANSTAAPNGTTTADTLTWGALSTAEIYQFVALTATTHIFSIWARSASGTKKFRLKYYNGTSDLFSTEFTATTTWQQFSYSFTGVAVSGNVSVRNSSPAEAGNLIVWGAQLEQSSTVGEYIPTTSTINSAPRFDHNPTTGESLGLLVEESKTNLFLQSNGFDTNWANTLSSETAASGIAPDGTNTAWELKDTVDAVASNHSIAQANVPFTSGVAYTMSVFAKAGTLSSIVLVFPAAMVGTATIAVKANLSTGAIIATGSGATASVTQYPNGWYRISATMTATAASTGSFQIRTAPLSGAGSGYQGDGNGTILIWGAQFEAGSFPTSYIPTTTAAVTRSADVASISGSNFSSWYRQDEGTVFYDGQVLGSDPTVNKNLLGLSNGTASNTIDLFIPSGLNQRFRMVNGSVSQALQNPIPTANVYSPAKVVYAFKVDDATSAGNGTVLATDTSCTIPSVDRFTFGVLTTGEAQVAARYKRLTFWPQRLPNETLQQITQ